MPVLISRPPLHYQSSLQEHIQTPKGLILSHVTGDASFAKSSMKQVGGERGISTRWVHCPGLSYKLVSRPIHITVVIDRTPRDSYGR